MTVIPKDRVGTPTSQTVTDTFRQTVNITDGDLTESGFVIRGINSEGLTPGGAGAPLASVYVDGVQQTVEAARRGMRGLFDAEQVEIYRGPQSTLTGRNALAGAIYVRTRDPDFSGPNGQAQFTYGSNNKAEIGVAYGDTITDNLAFRLSAQGTSKDSDLNFPSYEKYPFHDDLGSEEYYTLRGKLLWLPTHSEDTQVLFSYVHSKDSPATDTVAGENWSPGFNLTYADKRGDIYGELAPFLPALPAYQDVRDTTTDNLGLEINHRFSDALELTSLSDSYTDRRSVNYGYTGSLETPSEAWYVNGGFDQRILSQEIRLNYETDVVRWVAGVYGAKEKNTGKREQFAFGSLTNTRVEADI